MYKTSDFSHTVLQRGPEALKQSAHRFSISMNPLNLVSYLAFAGCLADSCLITYNLFARSLDHSSGDV